MAVWSKCLLAGLILLLSASGLLLHADAFRTFTDSQGRAITAKLLRPYGIDRVELEREDGERFVVNPEIFSADDQTFIAEWLVRAILAERNVLEISSLTRYGRKVRDETAHGYIVDRYPGYFRITLENRSDMDFQELTVEYQCFAFKQAVAANRRGEGRLLRHKGTHKLKSLAARQKVDFATDEIELMDTALKPGFYWADGGRAKSSDRMDGIWLRILRGDQIIAEFAQPASLPDNHDW